MDLDVSLLLEGETQQIPASLSAISDWLAKYSASVATEQSLLEPVVSLLSKEKDVPLEALPSRLEALSQVSKIRAQLDRLRTLIDLPPHRGEKATQPIEADPLEDRDWQPEREMAKALLHFLDVWNCPLPAPAIEALTHREPRLRLEEAVQQNERAPGPVYAESWSFLTRLFDPTQPVSENLILDQLPLVKLEGWLRERALDAHRLYEWTQYLEIAAAAEQAGVAGILQEVREGRVRLAEAHLAFRARFLRLWLDALHEHVPALRQFRTDAHEQQRAGFRHLDHAALDAAPGRIRDHLLGLPERPRPLGGAAPESSELFILQREAHKKRRHLSLRRLFALISTLLPRLKPCLMMSPLAVSAYLESTETRFDLVIFDEASQIRPHDAICAIYRGKQLLVAGDQKQLPPTTFFERGFDELEDDTEETSTLSDYESVLDVCCTLGLLRRRLRWHYRSRREPLIAFANHHFYDNELVTFPSVHDLAGNRAVELRYLPQGRWKAGSSGGYNATEARTVAIAILDHFSQHPEKSLGVIAFSQRQQLRIMDELERQRRQHPELEDCFAEDEEEPFFIKNLENVQGDERDVIFLSVGYGPDEHGKVAMRFGPLNQEGGARRLNVAITRAREQMVVFTSLRAQDLDLSRTQAEGVQRLRSYLDYADRGPEALRNAAQENQQSDASPFEKAVLEELTRQGLSLHRHVGCGGYRVDMAVVDSQAPERYLLGIECDGPSYQSAATARDRDRLRQEVLESLGWTLCRIWSTDWVRDRDGQIRRVLSALEAARRKKPSEPAKAEKLQPAPKPSSVRIETSEPEDHDYRNIDSVPENVLLRVALDMLRQCGATRSEELVKAIARQLGFKQTGKRIKARVEEALDMLKSTQQLGVSTDGRLHILEHDA